MKMTIGAAMAMALMLSLPLATRAQEVPPAPNDAADVSAGAVDTAAQEADNASNAAIDAVDNASDAAGDAIEDSAADAGNDQADEAQQASDDTQSRANEEANSNQESNTNRNGDSERNSADRNAQGIRRNDVQQPYTTGYRGARQGQNYNNQPGQPFRQGPQQFGQQQAYYNDGYQRNNGQQQAYDNDGQQGHAGQQTSHQQGADRGWGEQHPSVGQQEWMCIDGRRTLVTIVSVSPATIQEGSQGYPERAASLEDGQQAMPAAPQGDWQDSNQSQRDQQQNDRNTPPPVPQPNDGADKQSSDHPDARSKDSLEASSSDGSQPYSAAKTVTEGQPADAAALSNAPQAPATPSIGSESTTASPADPTEGVGPDVNAARSFEKEHQSSEQ